ncbi:KpsF/GutQ family sugar-phosphate isomerase [Leeia sp. TBRC 13508]|uniref:KpsF/GutQ family sugar-phosphate isomerase n=1 Tax=Leeia speluncae TaxID=2884804 RepID=A0ABS8D6P1_9NEIS|nr:KpsF/GutQ family sugar-phosphate isomerase [Leeia speluncae]MCB6183688.1 KpsF/GutQ family sugar-phosphate isomerase [Leeia speluncae]
MKSEITQYTFDANTVLAIARDVMQTEVAAVEAVRARLDDAFLEAIQLILNCEGRVVVSGMGKSGHIGNKIAATMASTGTPAFFMHPGEACHGDLGMLRPNDVLLTLSQSGESDEVLALLPYVKHHQIAMIALTGNPQSTLAKASTVHLNVSVPKEACPLGLAPTSSTTAALVMGDALAVALLDIKGFGPADFALTHPSGRLGRRLLMKVSDVMHAGEQLPIVRVTDSIPDALNVVTSKRLGFAAVLTEDDRLCGVFTDGDLRRAFSKFGDLRAVRIGETMTPSPKTIQENCLLVDAFSLMESVKITSLLVVNDKDQLVGALHMHDILQAGII